MQKSSSAANVVFAGSVGCANNVAPDVSSVDLRDLHKSRESYFYYLITGFNGIKWDS
jgi:hypothetical protein